MTTNREQFLDQLETVWPRLAGNNSETRLNVLDAALLELLSQPDVKRIFVEPASQTSRQAHFDCGAMDLRPGEKVMILVPGNLSGMLKNILLGHRKREAYWNLKPGENRKDYDHAGAYTRVRVLDQDSKWKNWQDPKGYDPVKYAERRSDVEYEDLHDWLGTVGAVHPKLVELTNMGKDPEWSVVTLHSVDLVTQPDTLQNTEIHEHMFSPGTSFIDPKNPVGKLPAYGGGKHEGGYPNAVPLHGTTGQEPFKLTDSVETESQYLENQQLHIRLQPNRRLLAIEVAIGDTWFNKRGKHQLGWAKLNVDLKKQRGKSERIMSNVNIPPQGVLSGGPAEESYVTSEGDEIIVSSTHTSYLMGWRILYAEQEHNPDILAKETRDAVVQILSQSKKLDLTPTGECLGTQGGQWHRDIETSERYFVKEYGGNTDRAATEYIASQIYQKMGIAALDVQLQNGKAMSKEVVNVTWFDSAKKKDPAAVKEFFDQPVIQKGFVTDAWLANWDMFGLNYDNILKTNDGRLLRTDFGGTLFYRAMGQQKPSFAIEAVSEVESMRTPRRAREAGVVFETVTDHEIREQIVMLRSTMTDDVIKAIVESSGISNAAEVISALITRRDWLIRNYLEGKKEESSTVRSFFQKLMASV